MSLIKYAFVDRDGTLAIEPPLTQQINSLEELEFLPYVISSLSAIQRLGYTLVMVTNQDNLGTPKNPQENYECINRKILHILASEGVHIQEILVCPHAPEQHCSCRKPKTALVEHLTASMDKEKSIMVGDRPTDIAFAEALGIRGFLLSETQDWKQIVEQVKQMNGRRAATRRTTNETDIELSLCIDGTGKADIHTGLSFFDHMLEQFAKHGQFDLVVKAHKADLEIDEHHLIEDVGICLGQTFLECLQSKRGIQRYSYEWLLPMDEARAFVAVDLSGRRYAIFKGNFAREYVGDFPTEMLEHFYHSFAMNADLTLHVSLSGMNNHHQVECSFKALAKCLHLASRIVHDQISSTKGVL